MNEEKKNFEGMIVIHGELFDLSEDATQLIRESKPDEVYQVESFLKGDFVTGFYDAESGRLSPIPEDPATVEGENDLAFRIPHEVILMAKRVSSEYMEPYNEEALANHSGFVVVSKALSDRLNGKLPIIRFDNNLYEVDIEQLQLRNIEDPNTRFSFDRSALSDPSEHYYDRKTKEPVKISHGTEKHYARRYVLLKFPPLNQFDIVGFAKLSGAPPCSLTSYFKLKPDPASIQIVELPRLSKEQRQIPKGERPLSLPHRVSRRYRPRGKGM